MKKKEMLAAAASPVASVVDSIVCLAPNLVPAGMPEEECGPACAWAIESEQKWALHQVLGFAATHAGGGSGAFYPENSANVFVLSDRPLLVGVHEAAAVWAVKHFVTYTEALRATHQVRWLPLLDVTNIDLAQIIAHEIALAEREFSGRESVVLLWKAVGGVTVETACEIGSAAFGFVAHAPSRRR